MGAEKAADGARRPSHKTSPLATGELRRIGQRLRQIKPRVGITIGNVQHGTYRDGLRLRGPIGSSDVYVPEAPGWDINFLAAKRAVSLGQLRPTAVHGPRSRRGENRALYGSRTAVTAIDYSATEALQFDSPGTYESLLTDRPSFMDALPHLLQDARVSGGLNVQREDLMVRNLPGSLEEVIAQTQALGDKDRIEVFLALGATHTRVYQMLKKVYPDTQRTFPYKPFVYPYSEELRRRVMFGGDTDGTFVARALTDTIIAPLFFYQILTDPEKTVPNIRRLIDSLSMQEMESFYQGWLNSKLQYLGIKGMVNKKLRAIGIDLKADSPVKTLIAATLAR